MEVFESRSRSLRIRLIALRRPLLVNCGDLMDWSGALMNQDAARAFSGCNFVDASIVGCV
jgi:hypothetical protein